MVSTVPTLPRYNQLNIDNDITIFKKLGKMFTWTKVDAVLHFGLAFLNHILEVGHVLVEAGAFFVEFPSAFPAAILGLNGHVSVSFLETLADGSTSY